MMTRYAIVGGFIMLFNSAFFILLKGFVNNQFTSSLRYEISPVVVIESDRSIKSTFINNFKRNFLSGTRYQLLTKQE
jgi:hypothetical protein